MNPPNPKTNPTAYLAYRHMSRDLEQAEAYLRRAAAVLEVVFGETTDSAVLHDITNTLETYTLKYNR